MVDNQSASAPAGWYAAGVSGEERWWDGAAWATATRPAGTDQPNMWSAPTSPRRGNKVGSLVMAIVCFLLLPPAGLILLWALASQSVAAVGAAFALLLVGAAAVISLISYLKLNREDAAKMLAQASPTHTDPTA